MKQSGLSPSRLSRSVKTPYRIAPVAVGEPDAEDRSARRCGCARADRRESARNAGDCTSLSSEKADDHRPRARDLAASHPRSARCCKTGGRGERVGSRFRCRDAACGLRGRSARAASALRARVGCSAESHAQITSRPPGRRTRWAWAKKRALSGMCSELSIAIAASKAPSGRSFSSQSPQNVSAGFAAAISSSARFAQRHAAPAKS